MAVTGMRTIEQLCREQYADTLRHLGWLRAEMQRELNELLVSPHMMSPVLATLADDPPSIKAALEQVLSLAKRQIDDTYPTATTRARNQQKELVAALLPTAETVAERIGIYNALITVYNQVLTALYLGRQQGDVAAMQAAVSEFRNLPQRIAA